jgi:rhodanese-related sulfurtransferase
MSAQLGRENVHDLAPDEVARGLAEGKILLVDVREPNETEVERYPEAFYRSLIRPRSPIRRAAKSSSPAARATGRSPRR